MLAVRPFRSPSLLWNGEPIQLSSRKARALLHILAEQPKSRSELGQLLWPNTNPKKSLHSLNQAISTIRQATTRSLIAETAGILRIQDGLSCSDLTQVRLSIQTADTENLSRLLECDYLADLPGLGESDFDDWRERKGADLLVTLSCSLVQRLDELGNDGFWERSIALCNLFRRIGFSFDVEVRRVRAHLLTSEHNVGKLEYQRLCEDVQARGFSTDDLHELKALLLPTRTQNTFPAVVEVIPFIGRTAEHRRIEDLSRVAFSGTSQICGILGVSGIGKTRLAERAVRKMVLSGARVVSGRCTRTQRLSPFSALRNLLRSAVQKSDLNKIEGAWREAISVLLPKLDVHVNQDRLPDLTVADNRLRMLEALTTLFTHMSNERPLVIFLDDIQWIDSSSSDAIAYLANTDPDSPMFILYTLRTAAGTAEAEVIEGNWPSTFIVLEDLDPSQVYDLTQRYLRNVGGYLSDQLAYELSKTCGNPFTLNTVLLGLRQAPPIDSMVPERISLRTRLQYLRSTDLQIISLLSVASVSLNIGELSCVAPSAEISLAINRLAAGGFVILEADRVVLAHDIIREELEHIVPQSRFRLLHQNAAGILASRGSDFAAIAWHAHAAGDLVASHSYAIAAAHESKTMAAYPESIDQLRLAADTAPTLSGRLQAEYELAELLHELKRDREAEILLRKIQMNLDPSMDVQIPSHMVDVYLAEIECEQPKCKNPTALLRSLYADLKLRDEPLAQVRVLARLAAAFQLRGDIMGMGELLRPLQDLAGRCSDGISALEAGTLAGTIILHSKSRRAALKRAAIEIDRTGSPPLLRLKTLRLLGSAYLHNGLLLSALATFREAEELAEEIGASILLAMVLNDVAVAELERKAFARAEALLQRSIEISESAEHARLLHSVAKLNLGITSYERGDFPRVMEIGDSLLRQFTEELVATSAHGLLALSALQIRDYRSAREHIDQLEPTTSRAIRYSGDLSYVIIPAARLAEHDGDAEQGLHHLNRHLARAIRLDVLSGTRLVLEKARLLRNINRAAALRAAGRALKRARSLGATLVEDQAAGLLIELGG